MELQRVIIVSLVSEVEVDVTVPSVFNLSACLNLWPFSAKSEKEGKLLSARFWMDIKEMKGLEEINTGPSVRSLGFITFSRAKQLAFCTLMYYYIMIANV